MEKISVQENSQTCESHRSNLAPAAFMQETLNFTFYMVENLAGMHSLCTT